MIWCIISVPSQKTEMSCGEGGKRSSIQSIVSNYSGTPNAMACFSCDTSDPLCVKRKESGSRVGMSRGSSMRAPQNDVLLQRLWNITHPQVAELIKKIWEARRTLPSPKSPSRK